MPKLLYYPDDAKLIKSKRPRFKKLKIFLFVALMLAVTILSANLMANFFSFGSFNLDAFFQTDRIKLDSQTLYFVNMDKFNNLSQAQNVAEVVALQGAGSFIWEINGEYVIVGNVYNTKDDANIVYNNIVVPNPKVFTSELKLPSVNLKYENYDNSKRATVKESLLFIKKVHEKLYELTLKLDTKEITPTTASSIVNSLKSDTTILGNKLDLINSSVLYESTIKIKNAYVMLHDILNELVLKLISENNPSHVIKYSYINTIKLRHDLLQNLQ